MKTGVVPPLGNRHWAKPITIGSASVIPLIDKARNLHAHRPAMDLQNTSYRAARSKDPPAHGRSLSSPPWSCRARAAAFRWLDRWRRLFAVLIAVFGDAVFFLLFHQLLDAMFSTSFVRALSMSFQFILISGLAVRRAISKILCCCCDYGDRVPLELMHRGDDLCRQNGTGRMAACLEIRDKRRRAPCALDRKQFVHC